MLGRATTDSPTDKSYEVLARHVLKGELARLGVSNGQLSAKLGAIGIYETESTIVRKISRGKFSAAFFLQCLDALGVTLIRMD